MAMSSSRNIQYLRTLRIEALKESEREDIRGEDIREDARQSCEKSNERYIPQVPSTKRRNAVCYWFPLA